MTSECPENHDDWRDYKANYCPNCGTELGESREGET
jgi:hypothetical protein